MTLREPEPSRVAGRPLGAPTLSIVIWMMIAVSLGASVIGLFWLRLWIAGLIIGIGALALSLYVALRVRRRPAFADARVLTSVVAVILPIVIALVSITSANGHRSANPSVAELQIELTVEAEGDFTVTYSEPLVPGAEKTSPIEADATDRFDVSFSGSNSEIQFMAVISQSNIGPQWIDCEIKINGRSVLQRTGEQRFVDCSANVQELHRDQIAPE